MRLRELSVGEVDHPLDRILEAYDAVYWGVDSLRQPYLDTEAARSLAAMQPRFGNYYWQDTDKFKELFGQDVDPLQHGPYQARTVAIPMIDAQSNGLPDMPQLADDFADVFVAHHVQHDDHEGLHAQRMNTNKDVPFAEQTEMNRISEYELWLAVQGEIFGKAALSFHLEKIECFAAPNAPESFEKTFWEISEAIGYLFTSLRAWDIATNQSGLTIDERHSAQRLAIEVSGRQAPRIEAVRGSIVYADEVLLGFGQQLREIRRLRGNQ